TSRKTTQRNSQLFPSWFDVAICLTKKASQ
ncbi:hypothetical protein VCHENC02_1098B, partial [Vibrio harveyi]